MIFKFRMFIAEHRASITAAWLAFAVILQVAAR